jgi:hypothetical protein
MGDPPQKKKISEIEWDPQKAQKNKPNTQPIQSIKKNKAHI